MAPIFAYILHKDGEVDDTALELLAAAKKIDPGANPTALIVGAPDGLDDVCRQAGAGYAEVWKVASDALGHPDAEITRKILTQLLPADSIVLLAHEHFGMDLAPGLS
ncbi:MAG: electron transfer flavoprotein subunit alpha/FixB family protein, partial [Desulfobacterales bacterium]|nr:electron transfer flavoprotein subunit alpha/FixB family protein [Desulfobacterales bacterium]